MPPKPKFTREEVAKTAFDIVKKEGLSALTARELGSRLGTSARPIFTLFKSMEEVKMAARELGLAEFNEYIGDYQEYTPAFKRIGMMMVSYSMHEPEVFKLLFMQEHEEKCSFKNSLRDLGDFAEICISLIRRDYGLTQDEASLLLEQMWTHTYGLCVMCVTGVCNFTEEEIGRRQGIMFASLVMFIKSGKFREVYSDVEQNAEGTFHERAIGDIPYISDKNVGNADAHSAS